MATKQSPGLETKTAANKLRRAYTKQFGQKCEDCGEDALGRRFRCRDCGLLVCSWCSGHVHRCRKMNDDPFDYASDNSLEGARKLTALETEVQQERNDEKATH